MSWQVRDAGDSLVAAELLRRVCDEHKLEQLDVVLHSDNGPAMKGSTMLATMRSPLAQTTCRAAQPRARDATMNEGSGDGRLTETHDNSLGGHRATGLQPALPGPDVFDSSDTPRLESRRGNLADLVLQGFESLPAPDGAVTTQLPEMRRLALNHGEPEAQQGMVEALGAK